jgi:osmoprotectant transport system substrate-binding protein
MPLALGLALALALGACGGDDLIEPDPAIVVGVGQSVEQRLLAALTRTALEQAGFEAELRSVPAGTVARRREALRGHIDLFWDYTGAAWALGLLQQAPPADPLESYERVRRADEDNDLVWLEPTGVNATLALFVRADDLPPADEPRSMSWLAGVLSAGEASLCADADFVSRPGGLDALAEAYAIDQGRLRVVEASEEQAIAAVINGSCFTGLATATSGAARLAGLVPVADDLTVFPAFVAAPVARASVVDAYPDLAPALAGLATRLDTQTLALLNAEIEAGEDVETVVETFLTASA